MKAGCIVGNRSSGCKEHQVSCLRCTLLVFCEASGSLPLSWLSCILGALRSRGLTLRVYVWAFTRHVGPLRVSVFVLFVFLQAHLSHGIRTHPNDLTITWSHLQRPYFQILSHSQIPGVRTWTFLLGDTMQTSTTTLPNIFHPCNSELTSSSLCSAPHWTISMATYFCFPDLRVKPSACSLVF